MSDKVAEETVVIRNPSSIDFSYQLNLSRERVEKKLFGLLGQVAKELFDNKQRAGALIVFGNFDSHVDGMRLFGSHRLERFINVTSHGNEEDVLNMLRSGDDGALIINDSGQVLGTGIYLTVDDPTLNIPEGAGTRHISAASFSTREDVLATFTLSEENMVVRKWKDGSITEQLDPSESE